MSKKKLFHQSKLLNEWLELKIYTNINIFKAGVIGSEDAISIVKSKVEIGDG